MRDLMFEDGDRLYIPGSSGTPLALVGAALRSRGARIFTSFVPGINMLASSEIADSVEISGIFMQPSLAEAQRAGRFRHLPMSYGAVTKWMREGSGFDTCIVQVAPPDAKGACSLGPAAEFTPEAMRQSKRIVAVVNHAVPRVRHAPSIAFATIDATVEADEPLVGYDAGGIDSITGQIAGSVSTLINDGAALQVGLGKVPHALFERLHDRRGLRLHSGMLSDGVIDLAAHGALDQDWEHSTTVVLGSPSLYAWLAVRDDIYVRGVDYTHDPARLSRIDGLIAVNSALEVDLFGQCNLEYSDGRAVSGAGGAPDFARGARMAPGGISVIALPATFGGGKGSRIVARLDQGGITTLPRTDVDIVITEEGIADLRDKSVHERAAAVIAIAAPEVRDELARAWLKMAARL